MLILFQDLWPYGNFCSEVIYNRNGRVVWNCQQANSPLSFVRKVLNMFFNLIINMYLLFEHIEVKCVLSYQ